LVVPDRSYTSFSQASQEASSSRLYGGIHWSYGNQDGLTGGRALGHYLYATQLQPLLAPLTGDFNSNGQMDAADIDALSQAVPSGGSLQLFDLNGDGGIDQGDRSVWIEEIRKTYVGDANLDGEFGSGFGTSAF
jgi:hypothetical protein